jgi:O-methyltransferase
MKMLKKYKQDAFLLLLGLKALIAYIFNRKKYVFFKGNSTYISDGFATEHDVSFLNEPRFKTAFESAFKHIPSNHDFRRIAWRAHIATWAANQAIHLKGDFVECGVWYGVLSRTICNYVDFKSYPGNFYLIDSWGEMEGSHANPNYKVDIFDTVKKRFADTPNVNFVRELVPEALPQVTSNRIAYLSIDMNGCLAERAALEYFYPRMLAGGIIYLDDYGWGYPELRKTVDEFFADKPETILHFPSGNSIVVKL